MSANSWLGCADDDVSSVVEYECAWLTEVGVVRRVVALRGDGALVPHNGLGVELAGVHE